MKNVIKKTGQTEEFKVNKIVNAILKAMKSVNEENEKIASEISFRIFDELKTSDISPSVDIIHDMVESELMNEGLNQVAKSYILYRDKHKANIFKKRTNLKPYEYPNLEEYVNAIRHSYWIHDEFNYTSDIQDFNVGMSEAEKTAVTRAMLAISQIEVAVKNFWGKIYDKMPKPEIGSVGSTFAESEVRHADAYSNLIKLLGLNEEFETLMDEPVIRKRVKYLEKAISNSKTSENKDYFESIILFTLFIENVSLFSQFLIIMSFNKFKNQLKGMSNAVEATSKEEQIHADFGFDLINIIKKENPSWWTNNLIEDIKDLTMEAYQAEEGIINWIFEGGELDFISKGEVIEFIKNRFNNSLNEIGIDSIFEIDGNVLDKSEWFDDEVVVTKHVDFFNKRSINYTKRQKSVEAEDLF